MDAEHFYFSIQYGECIAYGGGMNLTVKLSEWLRENFNRILVTTDTIVTSSEQYGVMTLKNKLCRDLTMGLLSTNDKEQFRDYAWTLCPAGHCKDDISSEWYNEQLLKLRAELTRLLFDSKNSKIVEQYLKILERRDKEHWSDNKGLSIEAKGKDHQLNITFTS